MSKKTWKIKSITPKIILITIPTCQELGAAVIRPQEYYESPIPEIRGKIFTLGYLKSLYSMNSRRAHRHSGGFTYYGGNNFTAEWDGFNFPSVALKPFIQGLFDPLTPAEQDLVDLFGCRTDDFYLIAVHEEDGVNYALEHEICHGLYSTIPAYKKDVDAILNSCKDLSKYKLIMKSIGYDDVVCMDEVHAYLSADWNWFIKNFQEQLKKFNITPDKKIHDKLRKVRFKHHKDEP